MFSFMGQGQLGKLGNLPHFPPEFHFPNRKQTMFLEQGQFCLVRLKTRKSYDREEASHEEAGRTLSEK